MNPSVHCSTVYSNQDTEATWMSIKGGMDTEDVVHTDNGILLSHEKDWNDAATWMVLEIIILIEDREKQILYGITYMWNLKESDTN